ncbi:thermostable hemolysin [Micavibrio aeruginosavorus]|uniref:thermostable hemolysin n=1 Tax=Micavibrio aeruginosavorus TaxID=349221 RepID=UPI000686BCD2|nr:thermostable hemolysin [Micavibrio aeruginosavorus]
MYQLDYQENGLSSGRLRLTRPQFLRAGSARPVAVSVFSQQTCGRLAVEAFIKGVYAKSYGAKINVHYPILMSVQDAGGVILSAVGFRYAVHEPLFLEQYLSAPIDELLQSPRDSITEIGNLASNGGGASSFLFAALAAYLHNHDQRYAVVTGTNFIEKRLRMMGLRPQRLAQADPSRLLHHDESWGTYYDTDPHVLAGCVDHGYRRLQAFMGAEYTAHEAPLTTALHYRGDLS